MASGFQWENIAIVGRGGSSTVFKAQVKPQGSFVAVKQIETDGLSKDQINGIKGEIETMKVLGHTNILCYLGMQQSPSKIFIFLEYADRGSLRQYYQNRGPLAETQISYCLKGILAGLNYLHDNGIAHRDIKCANCLLCSDGTVKLADFGASKRFESESIVSGLKGTPHWMAPEVIKGTQMTTGWMKADVWSLGCTVVEMFTANVPYAEYGNPMTAMYKIASGERPSLKPSDIQPNEASLELVQFMYACCEVEPTARPAVVELLSLPFISAMDTSGDLGMLFAAEPPLVSITATTEVAPSTTSPESDASAEPGAFCGTPGHPGSIALVSTSNAGAAQLHPHATRLRSESRGSVMSADDETTVANHHALDSSLDGDGDDYGVGLSGDWETLETPSRTAAQEYGRGMGVYSNSNGTTGRREQQLSIGIAAGATSVVSQGIAVASAAVVSGLPSVNRTVIPVRAGTHSRSQSRGREMTVLTGGSRDGLDSPARGLEDAVTPALHREARKTATASVRVNVMPLLGPVGNLSLSGAGSSNGRTGSREGEGMSTADGRPLVRKFSDAALVGTPAAEEGCDDGIPDDSEVATAESSPAKLEPSDRYVDEEEDIPDETEPALNLNFPAPALPSNSGAAGRNFGVPSFEAATETYQAMMLKYSPRADTSGAAGVSVALDNAVPSVSASVVAEPAPLNTEESDMHASLVDKSAQAHQQRAPHSNSDSPGSAAVHSDDKPRKKKAENAAGRTQLKSFTSGPVPARRLVHPPQERPVPVLVTPASVVAGAAGQTETRPQAPLTGEMLRLHNSLENKKTSTNSTTASAGSAEVLEKIINQSGAAAVRKFALHEIGEAEARRHGQQGRNGGGRVHALAPVEANVRRVKDQARGKGSQVHHTTAKAAMVKRPRDKVASHPSRYDSNQFHQYAVGANGADVSAVSIRSQSAGVNLSCEGGHGGYDQHRKLPPVLRGLIRGTAGSASGNITPIEEGSEQSGVHLGPVSRYIQSAPAVSRSVTLPPIDGTNGKTASRGVVGGSANGASVLAAGADLGCSSNPNAVLTSQTPKMKQPRSHRFGRNAVPASVASMLQQSFATAVQDHPNTETGDLSSSPAVSGKPNKR